jgi:hypothetical protein
LVNCVVMNDKPVTKQQLNKLIAFRQQFYECLPKAGDAQFQLVEALLSHRPVSSFAELSLAPRFARTWSSAYAAIEQGQQQQAQMRHLFCVQLPQDEIVICPLDTTVWPHPKARTLEGLVYEISPTRAARRHTAVVGHVYSLLAWVPERGRSWGLGLSNERLTPDTDALALGVRQVKELVALRREGGATGLVVVPVDGKYGTHRFLGPLCDVPQVAVVTRLRCDRVLYGPPPAYAGTGRPRKHGARFAFKDARTWHAPDADVTFWDARWGQVRLRGWQNLHMRQDAATPLTAIYVEVHLERAQRPAPIWLGYLGPVTYTIREAWLWFDQRWPIEPSLRFRKQKLGWTLPHLQMAERCDRWTWLVEAAFWQLYLGRELVQDQPLPWQKPQPTLTPTRVLTSFSLLFEQLDTPSRPVQSRRNAPGWPRGKPRTRPPRFPPQRRNKKRPKMQPMAA